MTRAAHPYGMTDADRTDRAAADPFGDDGPDSAEGEWYSNGDEGFASFAAEEGEMDDPTTAQSWDEIHLLASINPKLIEERLLIPNYPEDEAVRRAALDRSSWKSTGDQAFYPHGSLEVQLRRYGDPLPLDEVERLLERLGVRALLTVRIALGLWNLRRYDQRLCRNGSAAIHIEELLYWLGTEKHRKLVGARRRTDGWRREAIEAVARDLEQAEALWVSGRRRVKINGRFKEFEVDSAYIQVSWVLRRMGDGRSRPYGCFIRPGDWLNVYEEHDIYFLAPFNRRIFELHPQNDQYALRIALYLSERWRKESWKRAYNTPMSMQALLYGSAIAVPSTNIGRFAARIEAALTTLQERNIIGPYERCVPDEHVRGRIDRSAWLAAHWCVTPPADIVDDLNNAVRPFQPLAS